MIEKHMHIGASPALVREASDSMGLTTGGTSGSLLPLALAYHLKPGLICQSHWQHASGGLRVSKVLSLGLGPRAWVHRE